MPERVVTISKGNAPHSAMDAATRSRESQEEANRLYDQKFQDAAEAETVRCTLEKTEALEKLVKTVTMRADSLAITQVNFFHIQGVSLVRTFSNA